MLYHCRFRKYLLKYHPKKNVYPSFRTVANWNVWSWSHYFTAMWRYQSCKESDRKTIWTKLLQSADNLKEHCSRNSLQRLPFMCSESNDEIYNAFEVMLTSKFCLILDSIHQQFVNLYFSAALKDWDTDDFEPRDAISCKCPEWLIPFKDWLHTSTSAYRSKLTLRRKNRLVTSDCSAEFD